MKTTPHNRFLILNPTTALTRYGYTGREWDADTGLYYYRNRWYDPQSGRFISEDPIGLEGGINLYAYVENNPVDDTDPFGLQRRKRGGPYHPPEGVKTRCTNSDSCPALQGKMAVLMRMITSHQGWDWNVPKPRGGNRHVIEIAQLWAAYANCQALHAIKCSNNNPNCPAPARVPLRIPIGQSQGELDAQAEAALQRYEFWKKITLGGYLVGGVLTGGALFEGGGAASTFLVPIFGY